jgi:hypothetical protein
MNADEDFVPDAEWHHQQELEHHEWLDKLVTPFDEYDFKKWMVDRRRPNIRDCRDKNGRSTLEEKVSEQAEEEVLNLCPIELVCELGMYLTRNR